MKIKQRIKFPSRENGEFFSTVKQRVNSYFEEAGISKNANAAMITKTTILLTSLFALYIVLMLDILHPSLMLVVVLLMGINTALIGFNVGHDALHGSYSKYPLVNSLLSHSYTLAGVNLYIWKITHNVVHHTYTNIPDYDDDLDDMPFMRYSPKDKLKKHHRFQHIYAFVLYAFGTIAWVLFRDYRNFMRKRIGSYEFKSHPKKEIFYLFLYKGLYYFFALALPMMLLSVPFWMVLIGFFALHMVEGLTLATIFQLAHVVEEAHFPEPDGEGTMEDNWAIHQMKTTADFATRSKLAHWLFGGLNFQIEHHLFPHICHIHYMKISEIVKKVAAEFNVPYNDMGSLGGALRSHIRHLKRLGTQEDISFAH